MFSAVLAAFARETGAGPDNLVVLILDGAGWHTAADLVVPDGIRLEFLPPYSPELQPAEHLWPLIREPLANRISRGSTTSTTPWATAASISPTIRIESETPPASTGGLNSPERLSVEAFNSPWYQTYIDAHRLLL